MPSNGILELSNALIINYGKAAASSQEVSFSRPNLAANGTLGGNSFAVQAASEYSTSYPAWHAVDAAGNNTWWASNSTPQWYTFYNPNPLKVTSLQITNSTTCIIKAYTVSGSNDNSNYTQLTSGTNTYTTANGTWTLQVNSPNYYKYHKINVTSVTTTGGSFVWIKNIGITATYITTATNSIVFPQAFTTTNYAYSTSYLNGAPNNSYATAVSKTGITLQNNTTATNVYYMAIGY